MGKKQDQRVQSVQVQREEALERLAAALDRGAYIWLQTTYPDLVEPLETAVAAGNGVADIRSIVLSRVQNPNMQGMLLAAARHLSND